MVWQDIAMKVKMIRYYKHKNLLVCRQRIPVKGEYSLTQISQACHPENVPNSRTLLINQFYDKDT